MHLKRKNRLKLNALSKRVFRTSSKWRKHIDAGVLVRTVRGQLPVKRWFPLTLSNVYRTMIKLEKALFLTASDKVMKTHAQTFEKLTEHERNNL